MRISVRVPYDEAQWRRTIRFILRPRLRTTRILGAVMTAAGLLLAVFDPSQALVYVAVLLGLWFALGAERAAVTRSLRLQAKAIRNESQLVVDDEWIAVTYPETEARHRWTMIQRVVETDDGWYLMLSDVQALLLPKALMTSQQRAEFATFVSALPTDRTRGSAHAARHGEALPDKRAVRPAATE